MNMERTSDNSMIKMKLIEVNDKEMTPVYFQKRRGDDRE